MSRSITGLVGLPAVVTLLLLPGASAQASAGDPIEIRTRAATVLDQYGEVTSFCAPCGDLVPGVPLQIHGHSQVLPDQNGGFTVLVNGHTLPLESTYVRTDRDWFRNLAVLLDMSSHGAVPSLRVQRAGMDGELIVASGATPAMARAVAEVPPQASIAPAPTVVVVQGEEGDALGFALLAFLLSGVASGGMLCFLWGSRSRRQPALLPRAIHLRK